MKYKNLKGFKGSVTFNNHGQIIKTSLDQPQNIEPPLTYALDKMGVFVEQLPFPFPKQAVGKGAKWRVTSAVNVDKIAFTQIATYELVDFKDGVATFSISLQQLPQQPVPSEGTRNLPQLSQDSLYSQQYQSSGSGIAVIELNKLAPRNFKTSMRSDSYLSKKITNGSKRQPVIILRELSLQSQ
ncbi:MAG: hypothetical protein ICV78_17795 [Tolypothrix sp. Co-bin9]|nr:hypothetical protein [Tolypothrix sp. Co-bin9]